MADYLNDMLEANQELGDNENIFGAGNTAIDAMMNAQATSGTNVVDYKKYASVPDTTPIDYNKLTQISDKDVYNVVSVQETVITEDADNNVTKQTINYEPAGNEQDTTKLAVNENTTVKQESYGVDSDAEAENISTVVIMIENDAPLTFSGIGGNVTIGYLKSKLSKLSNCIFFDEDGYEIGDDNIKIEAIANIDGDKFIVTAKLKPQQTEPVKPSHDYTETVVVKNEVAASPNYNNPTDDVVSNTEKQTTYSKYGNANNKNKNENESNNHGYNNTVVVKEELASDNEEKPLQKNEAAKKAEGGEGGNSGCCVIL